MRIWSELKRLENQVLCELDGEFLSVFLDGGEAGRIAIAVHRATGMPIMTGSQWEKMPPEDRVPLLEATLLVLRSTPAAETDNRLPTPSCEERAEVMRSVASQTDPPAAGDPSNPRTPLPEHVWPMRLAGLSPEASSQFLELLRAALPPSPAPSQPQIAGNLEPPKDWLFGWREIASAVGRKSSDQKTIKSLNDKFEGPIRNAGAGTRPMVSRSDLVSWWNRLEIMFEEMKNQGDGERLSAEAQHAFGRDATAAPEIGGGVKKRR